MEKGQIRRPKDSFEFTPGVTRDWQGESARRHNARFVKMRNSISVEKRYGSRNLLSIEIYGCSSDELAAEEMVERQASRDVKHAGYMEPGSDSTAGRKFDTLTHVAFRSSQRNLPSSR